MKKLIIIILLLSMVTSSSYAITLLEKLVYKKDVIKAYSAKILVSRLNKQIKYLWYDFPDKKGCWTPVSGTIKDQFQVMYDQQIKEDGKKEEKK